MGLFSQLKIRIGLSRNAADSRKKVPTLLPLTPAFDPSQHQEYVDCLVEALADSNVRNIALTGRYGAGKSSVLQRFAELYSSRVLMLSLSTLGPAEPDESPTNQIEKELVKQLLHSRPPEELPQSRYRRIVALSHWKVAGSSAAQLGVVGGLLWFLGFFPDLAHLPGADGAFGKVATVGVFSALAVAGLTWLRIAVHNRVISSVSAAGASISLTDKEGSYFDKYLDEVVYYFQTLPVDVVVFEDLDRFNDPHIFEALRELNALLNASLITRKKTVQFVYALKDSIFEQLGHDTLLVNDDAAGAEAVRANRTKFFDLVIPVVPFITHRTSRDLLTKLFAAGSLVPVSPDLIDLTARHVPDMRLLKNIRNEYAVFAERLITRKQGIHDLRPDAVFAMMVYKNLHLADFEQVQLGRSRLDDLYRASRDLVDQSLTLRRKRLRDIGDSVALSDALAARSEEYGTKLNRFLDMFKQAAPFSSLRTRTCTIEDQTFDPEEVLTERFWNLLVGGRRAVVVTFSSPSYNPQTIRITPDILLNLVLGDIDPNDWDEREQKALELESHQILQDIEVLRSADFADLAERSDFTLRREGEEVAFEEILKETLKSEVGRDLVRRGFIDQNFALYVAQYYGKRVSMPAMNFIVQHVQPNIPDINYHFPEAEDIASVLRETKSSFLDQECAYNIAILSFLLARNDIRAASVLERIVRIDGPSESRFLESFLSEGSLPLRAVQRLAASWPLTLERLILTLDLGPERRLELVNEAVGHYPSGGDLGPSAVVADYLQHNYANLPCLTDPSDGSIASSAAWVASQAGVVVDDLAILDPKVRALIVESASYALTASNLRIALGDPDNISLDTISDISQSVFEYCADHPSEYLDAVETDRATVSTIASSAEFSEVITSLQSWEDQYLVEVCRGAAVDCMITHLTDVPRDIWPALALSARFSPTLSNVVTYMDEVGGIDLALGDFLVDAKAIDTSAQPDATDGDSETRLRLAVEIIGGADAIADPENRVTLAASLELDQRLEPAQIHPEEGHLLGLLIEHGICEDTVELFHRFGARDWETLNYAIQRSKKFAEFVVPDLLDTTTVARLLSSPTIDQTVKRAVLARMDEFAPGDHGITLRAAGVFAALQKIPLDLRLLSRIAESTRDGVLLMELIDQLGDTITPDETLDVLILLSGDYELLASPGATATLPGDKHHFAVLRRLELAGHLEKVDPRRTRPPTIVVIASA
ncbi:hypothetical protein [Kribbella sp. NPDC051770]|uniref:YobI family P-loop NTPase n=1 Tax=Kribbella sp. NPDC051770 TaxID=3155413 RepID=UPI003447C5AB